MARFVALSSILRINPNRSENVDVTFPSSPESEGVRKAFFGEGRMNVVSARSADLDRALLGVPSKRMQSRLGLAGIWISRYGLVVVLLLIGVLKFTPGEAAGIQPLVAHSPLMSWMYGLLPICAFSCCHQIDTAKLLPFNWNTALLNSFCIFNQIFGRNSLDTFLKKNPPYIAACEKCDWSTISVAS